MNADWQSWAVMVVVTLTAVIFAARMQRKKGGGCSSCGCGSDKEVARQAPDPQAIVDKAHR